MTKEDKIQESYGESYDHYKPQENGWSTVYVFDYGENFEWKLYDANAVAHGIYSIRPKSLKGIENNNGWVKIESEADLPKENIQCWLKDEEFGIDIGYFSIDTKKWFVDNVQQFVTHYQPIKKPQSPIF